MLQRQWLLLLLVLCVFAGPAFGQSLSFIDGTGNPASVVLEQDRAWLRVTDPGADLDSSQNTLEIDLTSQEGGDVETVTLTETGGTTGVFEGSLALSIEAAQIENGTLETGQMAGSTSRVDILEASYGAATAEADVVVSITELVDDQGNPVGDPGYGIGSRITVRVRSHHANTNAQQRDWISIGLYASGGDVEVLSAQETGLNTSVFESWAYGILSDGSFAVADGTFEVLPGETLEARVSDANRGTTSSDTTTFTAILVEWIDEQGNPATTYLEMSRAYIRATDATANTDPSTAETVLVHTHSVIGMDSQWVTLTETGSDTGVFEGWIDLGIGVCCPQIEEELDTSSTVQNFQITWDTLELTYGLADDLATTLGSYTYLLDEQGNPTDIYPMGSTIHIRVHEQANNNTPDVESVTVDLQAWAGGWDWERVTLTETGGDTGVFEGTIQTVESPSAVALNGAFEVPTLAEFEARHENRTVSYSYDRARMLSSTPRSVEFFVSGPEPPSVIFELTSTGLRVKDELSTGQGQVQVRITSELRGDTETVTVSEDSYNPGNFYGSISVASGWNGSTPENGVIETTEWNGPPHRFDTLRATLLCSGSPCPDVPVATVQVVGSTTRLTDPNGDDVDSYTAGSAVWVEVQDYGIPGYGSAPVTLTTSGGDSEQIYLNPFGEYLPIFRGALPLEIGAPVPGDYRLQVQGPETLVATHQNAQSPFSSSDTAILGGSTLDFLDRFGNPAEFQFENSWARVRAIYPPGNSSPGIVDTLMATLEAKDYFGNVRDTDLLYLVETGPDTGIFTGQMDLQLSYWAYSNDGILQTWFTSFYPDPAISDTLTVTLDAEQKTVPLIASRSWFLDSTGADATQYLVGSTVYIRVESEGANSSPYPNYTSVWLQSLTTGDSESVMLYETGPDTSIFEGMAYTDTRPAASYDGVLSVQAGETIRMTHGDGSQSTDEAVIVANNPPVAVDDAAITDEETWVWIQVTANDYDPENVAVYLSSVQTEPAHGVISFEPDGYIRYLPAANYSGTDSFQYRISDGAGEAVGTVTVTINPVNDPPNVSNTTQTTPEDTVLRFLFEASDPDGDAVALLSFTSPASGQLALDPDGVTFVYTPAPNFNGSVSFTYDTQDPSGATSTSSVIINVLPVQDPPVAVNDEATTAEDTLVSIYVRDNDSDPDGDTVWISTVTQGAHGQVGASATYLNYLPAANYYGTDSFTYTINDGNGNYATATVTVTITPVPDPPVAVVDNVSLNEDTPTTINALANDSDPDGGSLTVTAVTQPFHGSVAINADSSLTYTPAANYFGTDWFNYTIVDSSGSSATARVNLTIVNVNDPPNAVNDSVTTSEDNPTTVFAKNNDTDPDGDSLMITGATNGAHGTVSYNATWIGYYPDANYNGTDTFTYTVMDSRGATATGTVTVTITPANDAPVAVADQATTLEETPVTINVLANDTDIDGDVLSVSSIYPPPSYGTAVLNPNGTITYTPVANLDSYDSFSYFASDGKGGSSFTTVNITITPVNDPPDARDDSTTTLEDQSVMIDVMANDTDIDDGELYFQTVNQPAHGTVSFGPLGAPLTYQPNANFNGTDSFTYTIHDNHGGSDTATVTIEVTPVSDPPAAANDSATAAEDTAVVIPVLSNDSDVDGDSLAVSSVTQGAHGTVTFTGEVGAPVTYTPNANFSGSDSFTYRVSDGTTNFVSATVTVTVTPVNDPPVVGNDTATTLEDTPVTIDVLANDSDVDGDALTVVSYMLAGGAQGTLTLNPDKTLTYTPALNYNGNLGYIMYQASDGSVQIGGIVSLHITPVNDPPAAQDDSATTVEDVPAWIPVLDNDSDPDNHPLAVTAVTQGANGSVTFEANSVTYTPNADFNGADSFTYTISDGNGGSATATVSITVSAVNDDPVAANDAKTIAEDTATTIDALANDSDLDGDSLSVTAVTQGANGSVAFNAGSVTYTPAANFNGSDSFTYTISDGNGSSATATVSITVAAVNDAPVAANDSGSTNEDTAVTISVLTNDSDLDGDSLSVTAVTQGASGSVIFNAGSVTYTPAANFNGSDSFTYTIGDGNGGTATATVSITVSAVNDAPAAANDSKTTTEDTATTISVLANDSDPDGDTLSVSAVTQGTKGAVTFNASSVTYTPAANANGADSFTYTVSDGNGGTATATVAITINAVNDAPDAVNDSAATNEDTAVTISILSNDVDVDGEALTITGVTQGTRGSVVQNANGTVTYTPNPNTFGADTFTYTVRDAAGLTDSATVTVNVATVNDPPDAINDSATTNEGTGVVITVLANDTDLEGNALTVTVVSTPAHGTATKNVNNTISYVPVSTYSGSDTFTYTISDGTDTDTATVTVLIKDVIGNVAVLGTHGVWIQTGADVLSGDVIANDAGSAPFLNSTEVSIAGTTAAGWDVQGNRVTIASGASVASDVYYNQLTNSGSIGGAQYTPLSLPVFAILPAFLSASPGSTDVNVANNGTRTLAPGSYRDLIVGRKGTVTFTGGIYHFRSIVVDREAKLLFSAASTVRVQQKMSTSNLTTIGPGAGSSATAASIVFHVGGINGTTGALTATPKSVEIGVDNTVSANLYAPNGTIWLKDRTVATGAYIGRDVQVGIDGQVSLSSAW